MSEPTPTDDTVAKYLMVRNAVEELEERQKAELLPLKEKLDELSNQLLDICNANNADSIKTPEGTVSRRVSSRYWTSDWERMYEFIEKEKAPFLLEQRIHNGNMKQFMEENPGKLPTGLQSTNKYVIQVRKPTSK
jgi:hypothetical protein